MPAKQHPEPPTYAGFYDSELEVYAREYCIYGQARSTLRGIVRVAGQVATDMAKVGRAGRLLPALHAR